MALLLMGFAGAHRRSELVALTLADVTLHPTDGLHVRLRSVEDRPGGPRSGEGAAVRAGPGHLPAVRVRAVAGSAARLGHRRPGWRRRRAVMPVLRRQAANDTTGGGGEQDEEVGQHCCRTTRLPEPADPGRALFPTVHKTGAIGAGGDDRARGERDDPGAAPSRPGSPPPRSPLLGGHSLRAGFVTEAFRAGRGRALDHAADRAPVPGDARGVRPGTRPADGQRRHPPRPLNPMTAAAATTDGGRVLAPRTVRAYAADWALFTDWCAATGNWELPADPATVVAFLTDCPAAPATLRRRVAAIDHHHTATGHQPPGRSAAVLAALGRPTGEPRQIPVETAAAVEAALRALPSHGWTQGMFGRRDRCLLVLSQLAGVPYQHLATLTAGDVTVADGTATITTPALTWTLRPADDGLLCGPCAVTRWLRILNLVVTRPSNRDIAQALKKAKPATSGSPHLCRSTRGSGRRDPGGAVAAADRPMGLRAVPGAAADPALVVPPRPGPARR